MAATDSTDSGSPDSTGTPADDLRVVRDDDAGRYELREGADGDPLAVAAFVQAEEGVLALTHTETRPDRSGEGLATRLVEGLLDDVRERGLKVQPACAFVAAYVREHPDVQDLVAG